MSRIIKVGMADTKTALPPDKIRTSGLGSCVGIVLYDKFSKVSGMAHVMLPDSSLARQGDMNRAKYADTAIIDLIDDLISLGALKSNLKAKIAGGAQMFKFTTSSAAMRIGPRNVEAVKELLNLERIPLLFEDVGGSSGRTIEFDPDTSLLEIRTVNKGIVKV